MLHNQTFHNIPHQAVLDDLTALKRYILDAHSEVKPEIILSLLGKRSLFYSILVRQALCSILSLLGKLFVLFYPYKGWL